MLLQREKSCLLVVDIQEKLMPFIDEHARVTQNSEWLIRLAQRLNLPVLVSEQYPKGLGPTIPELKKLINTQDILSKVHFSCGADTGCADKIKQLKCSQIVIVGIETHVCVLQTAMDLLVQGYEVFVVVDAVSSRSKLDMKYALKRMAKTGVELVTKEMVLFEWLHLAGTAEFKEISQTFLKG